MMRPGLVILLLFTQYFRGAVETRNGLRELRADVHDLKDRSDHEPQEHRVVT